MVPPGHRSFVIRGLWRSPRCRSRCVAAAARRRQPAPLGVGEGGGHAHLRSATGSLWTRALVGGPRRPPSRRWRAGPGFLGGPVDVGGAVAAWQPRRLCCSLSVEIGALLTPPLSQRTRLAESPPLACQGGGVHFIWGSPPCVPLGGWGGRGVGGFAGHAPSWARSSCGPLRAFQRRATRFVSGPVCQLPAKQLARRRNTMGYVRMLPRASRWRHFAICLRCCSAFLLLCWSVDARMA